MAWTGLGSGHTAYLAVTAWASGCNCGHWARWRRWSAAGWSTCDPPKQRALFGLLLSRVDRPVSVDALLEEFSGRGTHRRRRRRHYRPMSPTCGGS